MRNITNEMTWLCREINSLRKSRGDLLRLLAQQNLGRKEAVANLLTHFRETLEERATKSQAELHDFVNGVKEKVNDLQQKVANLRLGFQEDLAGAHGAWFGALPAFEAAVSSFGGKESSREASPKARKKKRD